MTKTVIHTDQAPKAIGPYSQAIKAGSLLFISGQIALDPVTGNTIFDDIRAETLQAMKNLEAILKAAGASMEHIVKATLYISDMKDFPIINEIYEQFFPNNPPARACVEVSALPKGANFEIEAIAMID